MAFGSSTNPAWAGWYEPGTGYAFAGKYTPQFDIMVKDVAAYFDTHNGNGAHGWLCVWDGNTGAIIWSGDKGIINNASLGAGTQEWWTWSPNGSPNFILTAGNPVWIGGYCNQTLLYSTYDTSPNAYHKSMGTSGPGAFTSPTNSNQGPCGGYITYSRIVQSGTSLMGNVDGGIAPKTGFVLVSSATATLGSGPDGMAPVNAQTVLNSTILMGAGPNGIYAPVTNIKAPTIKVWRPR